jgi:2-oxoisovalerate dehydrogenase E2 component (dihydrolipoyl transacylase)
MATFLLPDLGEGLEEAQLVQWLVRVGDMVTLNQPLCQVETAKALVDIPSPYAGTVQTLHAAPGDTILVSHPLVTISESGAAKRETGAGEDADGHGPVLVGYGTAGPAQSFRRRPRGTPGSPPAPDTPVIVGGYTFQVSQEHYDASAAPAASVAAEPEPAQPEKGTAEHASPLVRKIARERGLDLASITGTGPGGRIRVEDLEKGASVPAAMTSSATAGATSAEAVKAPKTAGVSPAGDEERISTIGLRKAIAARMMKAATTIPHFTEYSLFDATNLVALRDRLREEEQDSHLTYLPFFVRAVVEAVRAYPIMNSRWDEEGSAIVIKRSIHVGIATDTERGLLVPVIHDAHTRTLADIATETRRLIDLARSGKIEARSLMNSTITITNVGAAGPVDTGAPLINPPEACVVGFGALKPRPTVVGDVVQVRPGAWISISCDHRIVDGASAARFMGVLAERLEQPERLL